MPNLHLLEGRNVALDEFPGLFEMEGHTGFFGLVFAGLWVGFALNNFPNIRDLNIVLAFVGIGAAFLVLMQISSMLVGRYFKRIGTAQGVEIVKIEFQVRQWIAFLTSFYAIVCCVLIWLTGGIASPFTIFYIMIFTLTISKCKFPHPAILVFLYFSVLAFAAIYAHKLLPSPIPDIEMTAIVSSEFHKNMHISFLFASLLVPLLSAYHVHLKDRERLRQTQIAQPDQPIA